MQPVMFDETDLKIVVKEILSVGLGTDALKTVVFGNTFQSHVRNKQHHLPDLLNFFDHVFGEIYKEDPLENEEEKESLSPKKPD